MMLSLFVLAVIAVVFVVVIAVDHLFERISR